MRRKIDVLTHAYPSRSPVVGKKFIDLIIFNFQFLIFIFFPQKSHNFPSGHPDVMMCFFRFLFVYTTLSMFVINRGRNRGDFANALLVDKIVQNRKVVSGRTVLALSVFTKRTRTGRVPQLSECPYPLLRRDAGMSSMWTESNSRSELGWKFVEQVEESLTNKKFVSLILRGAKKKKGQKNKSDSLRGSIKRVQGRLIIISSSKKKKGKNVPLLQITVKYHGATDICKNFQLEDVKKSIYDLMLGDPTEMASEWGIQAVRAQPIQSAQLKTTDQIWDLRFDNKVYLRKEDIENDPSTIESATTSAVAQSHDRVKQVPLSNQAEFLKALGVTNADGKPKPRMKGKLRQCQKFVEIVGRIVDECQKREQKKISIVDMGCGRAYLTFSLHSYLYERYGSVSTTGIDVRPKLVAEISNIAQSLGSTFNSLNFEEGTIEQVVARSSTVQKSETDDDALKILVALHACDTATDDALYSGISQNTDIIVVAPCCHKQIRPQMDHHVSSTRESHSLSSILKHGVYRERMSETVTDSLRALLLEYAGYKVRVFEFIGGEHTSKNVMITAIKIGETVANDQRTAKARSIWQEILSLASLYGIRHQKLAQMIGFDDLAPKNSLTSHHLLKKGSSSRLSKHRMPPGRIR